MPRSFARRRIFQSRRWGVLFAFAILLIQACHGLVSPSSAKRTRPSVRPSTTLSLTSSRGEEEDKLPPSALRSIQECLSLYQDSPVTVKFIDASWYHKGERHGRTEFEEGPRIVGSHYFDIDDLADGSAAPGVPRMLPSPTLLATALDAMGIRPTDHVIIYGRQGSLFTARVWFTLHVVGGHDPTRLGLLQGSLEDWKDAGGPIEEGPKPAIRAVDLDVTSDPSYTAHSLPLDPRRIATLEDIRNVVAANVAPHVDHISEADDVAPILLDARGSSFVKGHMPGAIRLPYSRLLESQNTSCLRPTSELVEIFNQAGVPLVGDPMQPQRPIICTCNSGVSACSLYLALRECGVAEAGLVMYDGSWNEYKLHADLPKVMPS
jgi:thiosulfate/3-mercaptopyruvate sulfurtransferase